MLWSSLLSALGIIGYYILAVRKNRWGLVIGVIYNLLWIVYAIGTKQWPFITICAVFVAVNVHAYFKWESKNDSDTGVDSGLTSVRVGNTRV